MALKMNLRMITKNHAADPEIGFLAKIDFKVQWLWNSHADSMGVEKQAHGDSIHKHKIQNIKIENDLQSWDVYVV